MILTNIDKLLWQARDAGINFNLRDGFAAGDFLLKEKAAREVTIPATIDGQALGFTICLVPHEGFYSKVTEYTE